MLLRRFALTTLVAAAVSSNVVAADYEYRIPLRGLLTNAAPGNSPTSPTTPPVGVAPAIEFRDQSLSQVVTSLAFGQVPVGSPSAPITFRVVNTGTGDLVFGGTPVLVAEPFILSGTTCAGTLQVSASCSITATFTPSAAQAYDQAALTLNSNAAGFTTPRFTGSGKAPSSASTFTSPGTYTFIVPAGVYALHAVTVGAGGGGNWGSASGYVGGGGGALAYVNHIPVTPGESLTVAVGAGAESRTSSNAVAFGGDSYIARGVVKLVHAEGGQSAFGPSGSSSSPGRGGKVLVGSGGQGGTGGNARFQRGAGGGGAGGYAGAGGTGGGTDINSNVVHATGGSGGAGAGGSTGMTAYFGGGGGGGAGLFGIGADGIASTTTQKGGGGGSTANNTGMDGTDGYNAGYQVGGGGNGGFPGGGGAGAKYSNGGHGANGAVRIIWGEGRSFPATNVAGAS